MSSAVVCGRYSGFDFNDNNSFSILQFAYDMLIIGKATFDNLWAIKAILRSFEMVSGLKINFLKSCLFNLNVDDGYLQVGSTFLCCRVVQMPFTYLGLPIGANPRKTSTWQPVIDIMRKRLARWKGKKCLLGENCAS